MLQRRNRVIRHAAEKDGVYLSIAYSGDTMNLLIMRKRAEGKLCKREKQLVSGTFLFIHVPLQLDFRA